MSLEYITKEMKRFLSDDTPSVICIKGKWGVGKTFIWNKCLLDAYEGMYLCTKKYSYVSLFGINSLSDLRASIVYNKISPAKMIKDVNVDNFHLSLRESKIEIPRIIASFFKYDKPFELAASASFTLVRNQLICIDDLERAGKGLDLKDVLGIASFLKEKRNCQVVIIYNQHEIKYEIYDFNKQIEKVSDKSIEFSLSPREAAKVAIDGDCKIKNLIRLRIENIKLSNIRIIKRIENYINEVGDISDSLDDRVIDQIVTAFVLGSWSFYQPGSSPPLSYIRQYNRFSVSLHDDQHTMERKAWDDALDDYPYNNTDELDRLVYDGIESGVFDIDKLKLLAGEREKQIKRSGEYNSFNMAWEKLFHGSLNVDDDYFLETLYDAAKKNINDISIMNINSTIEMMRKFGKAEYADDLIDKYIKFNEFRGSDFFDVNSNRIINGKEMDPALESELVKYVESYVDNRVPLDVLKSMADRQTWDNQDLRLLSKQSSETFEEIFLALRDATLRRAIELVVTISRQRRPEADAIRLAAGEALRRIAAKSPIRALKLRRYGIDPERGISTPPSSEG